MIHAVALRDARADDFAAIAAIYGHHVRQGTASFELEPPAEADMRARWRKLSELGLPWIVAEDAAGRVLGYAYASRYRERPAYDHTVEDSVYLAEGCAGAGIGRRLLEALIARCAQLGKRQMVAVIADHGAASIALHSRCGFRPVGVLEKVGFKHGRWLDTVLMQRDLTRPASFPNPDPPAS